MGFKTLPSKLSDAVLTVANVAALSDVTDPQEGDERYVADIDVLYMYTGAAWAPSASSSGAPLAPSRGGTGISNNDAATLTRSGNHALTVTTTGTTGVTLPTSGTLGAVPAAGVVKSSGTALTSETALSPANGGTGVANNAAATLTRSGGHAWTVTTTATSNTTMPAGTKTVVASGDIVNADIAAGAAIEGSKIAAATASTAGVVAGGTVPGQVTGSATAAGYIGEEFTCGAVTSTASSGTANTFTAITGATISVTAGVWLVTWAAAYTSGDQSVIGVSDDAGTSFVAKSNKTTGIVASSNTIGATILYRCSGNKTLALYMKSKGSATCTVFTDDAIGSTLTNDGGTHITAVRIG